MYEFEEYKRKNIKITWNDKSYTILPDAFKYDLDVLYDEMRYCHMDIVMVIDGIEGTGKSYSARVIGNYFSKLSGFPFSCDNIHFTAEEYIKASDNGKKFQVNIMDESRQVLNKKRAMSKSNIHFTNWLSENRDKQQVHLILANAIHDLDSYMAIWRTSLLMHHIKVHHNDKSMLSGKRLVQGYFKIFNMNQNLQKVMWNRAKFGYYAYPLDHSYQRRIVSPDPLQGEEYQKYLAKKADKRKMKYVEIEKETKKSMALRKLVYKLVTEKGMKQAEISKLSEIAPATISDMVNDVRFSNKSNINII